MARMMTSTHDTRRTTAAQCTRRRASTPRRAYTTLIACACVALVAACLLGTANAQDTTDADTENTPSAVTLGQELSSPTMTGSTAPPTTYLIYFTVNGVQTSSWVPFTATTPTPSTTIAPLAGTIVQYSSYVPPSTATSTTGAASPGAKFSPAHGQVAAFGVLLSMLVGAAALF